MRNAAVILCLGAGCLLGSACQERPGTKENRSPRDPVQPGDAKPRSSTTGGDLAKQKPKPREAGPAAKAKPAITAGVSANKSAQN